MKGCRQHAVQQVRQQVRAECAAAGAQGATEEGADAMHAVGSRNVCRVVDARSNGQAQVSVAAAKVAQLCDAGAAGGIAEQKAAQGQQHAIQAVCTACLRLLRWCKSSVTTACGANRAQQLHTSSEWILTLPWSVHTPDSLQLCRGWGRYCRQLEKGKVLCPTRLPGTPQTPPSWRDLKCNSCPQHSQGRRPHLCWPLGGHVLLPGQGA